MSSLPLNKEYRSCCNVCVDVLSRHLPFFLVSLFRFCDVDDQLLLELLVKVGYLYLWIAFNAKKDINYNKKTEGRRGCLNTGYHKTVHPFRNFLVVVPPSP